MDSKQNIKQAITDFVRGGDKSDVELLNEVLHSDFRVCNNGFMGTPGLTVISKQQYLENIRNGVFGGVTRKMLIENIDQNGSIALVKLRLESEHNNFVSYNSLILDTDDQWRIVNNLAVVASKS